MTTISPLDLILYLAAGAALGAFYFTLLRRTVRLHAAGASVRSVLPLYILRLAAAVAGFWLIAQEGAWPLLLALAGFVIARLVVQYRVGAA